LEAVVETVCDVIFRPLTKLGLAVSHFFNAIIERTPTFWTPGTNVTKLFTSVIYDLS
jgi:hypothetical protein